MSIWIKKSLGEIATYINGRAFKPEEWKSSGVPIIRIENLNNPKAVYNYYQGEIEEHYKVNDGDILVSWSASLDAYVWDRGPAVLNQHIFKVIPSQEFVDKDFLFFILKKAMKGLTDLVHGATMKHVNRPVFEAFKVTFPEKKEWQKKLAISLTKKLAEAERARIASKNNRIELKRLLNMSLENEVLKALGSGSKKVFLGDIIEISSKLVNPTESQYCNLIHVSAENIESISGKVINLKTAKEDGMTSNKYMFDKGDVLYSKLRPYLRKVALPDFMGLCSADMYPLKCNVDLINNRFLKLLLTSNIFTDYANEMSARSRMPKLNRDQLYNWKLSLPTLESQMSCVRKVENLMEICTNGITASDNLLNDLNILPVRLLIETFEN